MNVVESWRALWAKAEDEVPQLKHESWTGSRMGILLIIGGLMVAAYLGHQLLSDTNMICLTVLGSIYMISNTITKTMTLYWNGRLLLADHTDEDRSHPVPVQLVDPAKV